MVKAMTRDGVAFRHVPLWIGPDEIAAARAAFGQERPAEVTKDDPGGHGTEQDGGGKAQ